MSEQQSQNEGRRKRQRLAQSVGVTEQQLPGTKIDAALPINAPFDSFDDFQVLHIPQYSQTGQKQSNNFTWKDIQQLYLRLSSEDKESWCIETASEEPRSEINLILKGSEFLKPETIKNISAYCSFLVQKDTEELQKLIPRLPVATIQEDWQNEPCIWIFFGRNHCSNNERGSDLQGRPEHTDSISHDGTWHFQLSGTKRWLIRPTPKLMEHLQKRLDAVEYQKWAKAFGHKKDSSSTEDSNEFQKPLVVDCNEGDVLVINTRLWFHQTIIPPQDNPSVSYARDFWISEKKERNATEAGASRSASMTNVDGLYATDDIEEGTIIFRESDMPDCELHRSSDKYNCEVVELEDGMQAVISSRSIVAGEFFCLAESEEEIEDWEDEEEVASAEN